MLSTSDKSFLKFAPEAFSRSILFVGRGMFFPWLNLTEFYTALLNLRFKYAIIVKNKRQNLIYIYILKIKNKT